MGKSLGSMWSEVLARVERAARSLQPSDYLDTVGAAMLRLWRIHGRLEGLLATDPNHLWAMIVIVTRHIHRDRERMGRNYRLLLSKHAAQERVRLNTNKQDEIDTPLDVKALLAKLKQLCQADERCREAWALVEEISRDRVPAVAAARKVSQATLRVQYHRALQRLRNTLGLGDGQ